MDGLVDFGRIERAGEELVRLGSDLPMCTVGQRRYWVACACWLLARGDVEASLDVPERLFDAGLNTRSGRDIPVLSWRRGRALIELDRLAEADDARSTLARIAPGILDAELQLKFEPRSAETFAGIDCGQCGVVAGFDVLTAGELDVALFVARKLSSRQMGDELVIGERTMETRVGNVLGKLGFSSRIQIAAWIVELPDSRSLLTPFIS